MDKLGCKIIDYIKYSESLSWNLIKSQEDVDLHHLEDDLNYVQQIEANKYQFSELINTLVKLLLVFFEREGLDNYLEKFKSDIVDKIDDSYLFEIKFDPELPATSRIIEDIKGFLLPFSQFDNYSEEQQIRKIGIRYLENILNQTSFIIHESGKNPQSEVKVYNQVKIVIESTFPDSKKAGSNFRKIAKEYKPDILIPELEVAVEYKFANSEEKLIRCIEQILVDVKGYQNDADYKLFYAVFYVTNDFIGQIRFNEIWKDYSFPRNWKGIYCIGR